MGHYARAVQPLPPEAGVGRFPAGAHAVEHAAPAHQLGQLRAQGAPLRQPHQRRVLAELARAEALAHEQLSDQPFAPGHALLRVGPHAPGQLPAPLAYALAHPGVHPGRGIPDPLVGLRLPGREHVSVAALHLAQRAGKRGHASPRRVRTRKVNACAAHGRERKAHVAAAPRKLGPERIVRAQRTLVREVGKHIERALQRPRRHSAPRRAHVGLPGQVEQHLHVVVQLAHVGPERAYPARARTHAPAAFDPQLRALAAAGRLHGPACRSLGHGSGKVQPRAALRRRALFAPAPLALLKAQRLVAYVRRALQLGQRHIYAFPYLSHALPGIRKRSVHLLHRHTSPRRERRIPVLFRARRSLLPRIGSRRAPSARLDLSLLLYNKAMAISGRIWKQGGRILRARAAATK